MPTAQVEFTESELLMSHDYAEPLVAAGVRCHGGFDDDGTYRSPRTRFREPAIAAWEQQRLEQFGTPILDAPLDTWPTFFPNVDQAKFLVRNGVREPIISVLTRIGTVEGFGGMLRLLPVPEMQSLFLEDVKGTATDHLSRGLFEAHARDEAGFGDEAGHNTMWFIARDIAFENPVSEDQTQLMLERMGLSNVGQGSSSASGGSAPLVEFARVLPDEVDPLLEIVVSRMINLLFIEISAFHGFRWAEAVLSDSELVAGDGEAASLVAKVRADETPHVAYLRTALSEMRDRTWVGNKGSRFDGNEMMTFLWDQALETSTMLKRAEALASALSELEHAVADRPDGHDLIDEMLSMGTVVRQADGTLVDAPGDAA